VHVFIPHFGALALDKTGTITHGKPVQTDYVLLDTTKRPLRRRLYSHGRIQHRPSTVSLFASVLLTSPLKEIFRMPPV
jgi:hypothetical protein